MKILKICMLSALFLLPYLCGTVTAQNTTGGENYYSNPKKGITASAPKPYYDTSVVNKSDNITVELVGESLDTTPSIDSTKKALSISGFHDNTFTRRIQLNGRGLRSDYFDAYYTDLYWYTGNPYYWGPSIYYSWDPWFSPHWNGWYHHGWGGSYWQLSYGWGWGPYWSWGWGSPWYYDPFYYGGWSSYYGWGGYYGWAGYYGWGSYYYPYGRNRNWGHQYLGHNSRSKASSVSRNNGTTPSPSPANRGSVRRGGVDLNNGGRGRYGNVSGTGSVSSRNNGNSSRSNVTTSSNGRYSRPASVAQNRQQSLSRNNASRTNNTSATRTSNNRNGYNNATRTSNRSFDNGSRSSSSSRKAAIAGSARKRRTMLPSQRAFAAASRLMPVWWAMTQRTNSPSSRRQREGVKSRAS